MKKLDKNKLFYYSLVAAITGIFLFFSYARVFDEFEYSTLDLRYKLRLPQKVSDNIVIVEIGDDSISKLGKWPFPRNYHALVLNALKSAGARTIVLDVFFSEPKPEDEALAKAVEEAGNVYMAYVFDIDRETSDNSCIYASRYAAPLVEVLNDSAGDRKGFVNVEPDQDGKIRQVPAFIEYEGKRYPHITLLAAVNDLGYDFDRLDIVPSKNIKISEDLSIPLGEMSEIMVNYPAKWGKAFRHYSYVDVMQSYLADLTGQPPIIDLSEFKDSICFIGLTATASPDAHPSPAEPLYPGIGVHTSIYNSIINNNFLFRLDRWWNLIVLLLMWILTGVITSRSRKRFAIFSILLIMTSYVLVAFLVFWIAGVWIDIFYPLVTMSAIYVVFTFKKYLAETQKRELIEKELNIAKDIQQSFLPREIPEVGELGISAMMRTARQVGGDLYDIVKLDDDRLAVMLGDVSGKGVPAALYMAKVVSVFKTYVGKGAAAEVVKKINDRLVFESSSGLFVTLTYMVFNVQAKNLEFAIGGHNPTLLIEPDGNIELLDLEEGMPLGMIESNFSEGKYNYRDGSIFVMYTDGVTEAMDTKGEMFGEDRLVALARTLKGKSAEEVAAAIQKAVKAFEGKAKQHDDITVMAIRT